MSFRARDSPCHTSRDSSKGLSLWFEGQSLSQVARFVRATVPRSIEAIALERALNGRKARQVRWAFRLLVVGLLLVSVEAGILAWREV
jgi:hypothetical protein